MTRLFDEYRLGDLTLDNRVVMAPMTRARCTDTVAGDLTAEYYRQRSTAGLIVTEGTPISPGGQGYAHVPGIWSTEQVNGWRGVTESVRREGGRIFVQLWHVGRLSHTSLQPEGRQPVSASSAPARDGMTFAFTEDGSVGFVPVSNPRPMSADEVESVTRDFVDGAANARNAGFDGVELHGANGYLFEQFLNPSTNTRGDRYGGSLVNRARFLLETVERVSDEIGVERVGIRLSPFSELFDMPAYPEAAETYLYLASELTRRGIAYVHLIDQLPGGRRILDEGFLRAFRNAYAGSIILAGGMTLDLADHLVGEELIDLAAFGQSFVANPDLVERLRNGWPLATPDRISLYGGGPEGYLDYPRYEASIAL